MSPPSVTPRRPDVRRSLVGPARLSCVLLLIITLTVIECVMIIGDHPTAPVGGWVWPITAAVTAICWSVRRTRPGAVLLLLIQTFVLWSAVLFPGSPTEQVSGRIQGLDQALLAVGAADLLRCFAAGIALLACVLAFGRTTADDDDRQPPRALRFGIGVIVAALVVAIAVPAGFGLQRFSRARVINSAEESQVFDRPDTSGLSTVTVGDRPGWSRGKIAAAQPAGDRVIAIESGSDDQQSSAVVGLRATDGAMLWRYRIGSSGARASVDAAVIDPNTRMIMIHFGSVLIGLDFDGAVRYHKPLAESVSPTEQPSMIGDVLGSSAPEVQTSGVAVFGGYLGGSRAGFAAGYDVSTGEPLWQYTADSDRCPLARAVGPGKRVYLLAGGEPPCRTELIAYDGPQTVFHVTLHAPDGFVDPSSQHALDTMFSDVPPTIAAVGADRVVTSPRWRSGKDSSDPDRPDQQVTQIFDSGGNLLGTSPPQLGRRGIVRMLPTPLSPAPDSAVAVVLAGEPGSDSRYHRWVTLSSELKPIKTTKITSGTDYRRIGPMLATWPWDGADSQHAVTLTTVGSEPGQPEQLEPAKLDGCGDRINWISTDDSRMAIRCGSTILVSQIAM
ncbi:PQQ-binding-like beta-propeller repeat protein [Microlunatus soli]|uniref:PQQ-like domain-containing protein n=1 Tax=Microlunatus soli TaxID=630515 RepID=A0A1H1PCE6_9ACTN|nr:PQQ-binding-like beta-propeller repeat protein [Microlunatus soli]SDS08803.1 hypothetical protein SAMN04489812_0843 [Microlunatus soli]